MKLKIFLIWLFFRLLQDLQQTFETGQSSSTGEIVNLLPHQRVIISIVICYTYFFFDIIFCSLSTLFLIIPYTYIVLIPRQLKLK